MSNTAETCWLDQRVDEVYSNFDPIPLVDRIVAPEYPLEALGSILGEAAERLRYYVQTPPGMAGQSVLAAAALAIQGTTDVQRGPIGDGPVSLMLMTIAESGDRKSSIDRLALSPIRAWEAERREALPNLLADYRAAIEAWQLRRESVVNGAKPKSKEPMNHDQQMRLRDQLLMLDAEKPEPPPRPNITFEEPTAEGSWRHFHEGEPSAGLFSDEAIGFFGGHGMSEESRGRTIAMLSKLWDGSPITRTRGTSGESGIMAGRRLSAHLMLQPVVSAKVLGDPLLMGQGFLARFLVCHEPSMAGTRFLKGRDLSRGAQHDPAIGRYWQSLSETIRTPLDVDDQTGELRLRMAKIEGDAFTAWCALHDSIEHHLSSNGRFIEVKAFASKAADNAARIAAVLALVEGHDSPQREHIERAGKLMAYYLESMAVRTAEAQQDMQEVKARELLEWITDHGGELHAGDFKRLPNAYRSASKARPLLTFLMDMGHIEISATNHHGKPSAWRIREIHHD
ncbi:MAG: YfjI family protein [Halomonas sp.]|uniref:YfjI family protein n=1 Tax=Halomonas TaxID=2745 RepID=UPI000EBF47DE|nr:MULTISPECIES: YfjI family protein [Halomonas]HCR96867.1 hypothetical protein [Halomonas sp.]